jgi:hypothetical protein
MGKITHLVFTDLETTAVKGPNTTEDQIIEVAAVKVCLADRLVVDEFTTLIQPKANGAQTEIVPSRDGGSWDTVWQLGKYHLDAGHFSDVSPEEWLAGMTLEAALTRLAFEFFPGATFAGNNVPFDVRHYRRDFAALGMAWPKTDYHVIDLASPAIFLAMTEEIEGVSLRHSAAWAGRPPQKHRALSDCHDAIAAFWAMFDFYTLGMHPKDKGEPMVFDLQRTLTPADALPPVLTPRQDSAPDTTRKPRPEPRQ